MKLTVGAYAASPALQNWNESLEREFLTGLWKMGFVGGLEIPFFGSLHRFDEKAFFSMLKPEWNNVLTLIPGVMENLKTNPHEGLASLDNGGREKAVQFVRQAFEVAQKNQIRAVEIHSAPTLGVPGVQSSREALIESLQEISRWNWGNTKILIEHCDAFIQGRVPAKGFLSLEDEIEAIKTVDPESKQFQILINWGRSAIEGHDPDQPREHIENCVKFDCLGGLIFSGVAENDPLYGDWADSHAPFNRTLMTQTRVHECIVAATRGHRDLPDVFGFKIQALPKTLSVSERLDFVANMADLCLKSVPWQQNQ